RTLSECNDAKVAARFVDIRYSIKNLSATKTRNAARSGLCGCLTHSYFQRSAT
ncbi:MAG: hypothetical protein ACI9HB_002898, partial [Gammaproteobacteria bacterium]